DAQRFDPFNMQAMGRCLLATGLALRGDADAARGALEEVGPESALEPRSRAWHDRARTWIAAAEGGFEDAAETALAGGRRALDAGLRTWAASLLFDAVRVGHPAT